MNKPTKGERRKRVSTVRKMLGQGRAYIIEYCAEKWDVQEGTADTYIRDATAQLIEKDEVKIEEDRAIAVEEYRSIKRRARTAKDYNAEIRAQTRIDKIKGLEAPIKQELTFKEDPSAIIAAMEADIASGAE